MATEIEAESVCPIAYVISVVGDRWTLLILREISLGVHRFDGLQAQTGISSHLLAARLRGLESHGLLERRLYADHPKRYEYHATTKCKAFDPVLLLFSDLGQRWRGDSAEVEPAITLRLKRSGQRLSRLSQYPGACEDFTYDQAHTVIGRVFQAEREAKIASFRNSQRSKRPPRRARSKDV